MHLLEKRPVERVLAPLNQLVQRTTSVSVGRGAGFVSDNTVYRLPRYVFSGPPGGDEPIRVGLFAGVHGDEPEGVHALIRFLELLERAPEVAAGYTLYVYPICNPTGFEDRTRHSRNGKDLNREFWRGATEPEIAWLEAEIIAHSLHGMISLHTDADSHGFYGFARGATLSRHLLEPALQAVEQFLPRNRDRTIDGFRARDGIIRDAYDGILSSPPKARPRPFELILETPQAAPAYLKEAAFIAALQTILVRYRELMAYAPNL